jgi:hypothetical protein
MRRLLAVVAPLVLLAGCASGGSAPSGGGAAPTRRVLVEVRGSAPEAEAFASRFLYEADERGASITDVRLAGRHLADLSTSDSDAGRDLKERYPADLYLSAEVGGCEVSTHVASMPGSVDPMTGVRTQDVIGGADTICTVTVVEAGPDGKVRRSATVNGRMAITQSTMAEGDTRLEAARDAASSAAKKLFGKKK